MYSQAFRRFWWVLVIGLVAGLGVGGYIAKKHQPPTYTASSQLLVDSAQHPFLRASLGPTSTSPSGSKAGATLKVQSTQRASAGSPDTQVLVDAANFYPLLINSDVVQAFRTKLFGAVPGTVTAQALDAKQGQNRYVASIFPIIEIDATGPSTHDATRLATQTATAFQRWLAKQQTTSKIAAAQRISVHPIVTPTTATMLKHTHYSLAAVAGTAVLAAFLGLTILLDRALPRHALDLEAPSREPSRDTSLERSLQRSLESSLRRIREPGRELESERESEQKKPNDEQRRQLDDPSWEFGP